MSEIEKEREPKNKTAPNGIGTGEEDPPEADHISPLDYVMLDFGSLENGSDTPDNGGVKPVKNRPDQY